MNAIIIAAGSGQRISNDIKSTPKSLININGKPIINYQIEVLKKLGINNITVITGKYSEKFEIKNIHYINDNDHEKHNILGSLMKAKNFLKGDVIVLYSDIIFESKIIQQMLDSKENISIAIDMNWEKDYEGRTDHPKSEAENVSISENGKILQIKKNIVNNDSSVGEFLGIIKFSNDGSDIFIKKYDEKVEENQSSFHGAPTILKAYLTDMLQELIECEIKIKPIFISGKWSEIDTMQDLKNAEEKFSD
jgi:L-glutamine-phosphate cytidylyltransferase